MMSDNEKHFVIRNLQRPASSGDKLVEKGSRVMTQGPAMAPPPPKTPAASANTPVVPVPAKQD
jgi:hypothetical protein